ncbi:MAG: hypothetical protein ACREUA_03785 [Burkholderiales bacterium]
MKLTQKQRWAILASASGLTLAAMASLGEHDESQGVAHATAARAVDSATPQKNPKGGFVDASDLRLDRLKRQPLEGEVAELFESKSWYVPPPPPPAPAPVAPPLPFTYLGKFIDEGQTTVFLSRGERNYIVKAGDTIDSTYKVEEIGVDSMAIIYLPLKSRQTLDIGEAG